MKLQTKIILVFAVLALVPAFIRFFIVSATFEKQTQNHILEQEEIFISENISKIRKEFEQGIEDLYFLENSYCFQSFLAGDIDEAKLRQSFDRFLLEKENYYSFEFRSFDSDDNFWISNHNNQSFELEAHLFDENKKVEEVVRTLPQKAIFIHQIDWTSNTENLSLLQYVISVYDEQKKKRGIFILSFDLLKILDDFRVEPSYLGRNFDNLIIDNHFDYLYLQERETQKGLQYKEHFLDGFSEDFPQFTKIFLQNRKGNYYSKSLSEFIVFDHMFFSEIFDEKYDFYSILPDHKSFFLANNQSWVFVSILPKAEVDSLVAQNVQAPFIFLLLIYAFVLMALYFIVRFLLRPLEKLKEGLHVIKKGNYGYKMLHKGKGDFAEIFSLVNILSKQYKQAKENTENVVEKRTKEIETMNKFMINREQKMLDLKEEIKQLKKKK